MGSHRWSSVGAAVVVLLAAGGCAGSGAPREDVAVDQHDGGTPETSTGRDPGAGSSGGEAGADGEGGAGGGPPREPPSPAPPPSSAPTTPADGVSPDEQVAAFVRDCEQSVDTGGWRPGQVLYPGTMSLEVGQEETYNAAVDVRADPAPPQDVIDSSDPTSEPVQVRCVLSARLVPVGDHISVATDDHDSVIDGWSFQTFTPNGIVEWSWTVVADAPAPGGLRLVLRPAAVVSDVLTARVTSEQRYETDVAVTGSALARAEYWVDTEFPFLKTLAITLGTALVAVLAWFGGVRTKWRELRGGPAAGEPVEGARTPSSPGRGGRAGKKRGKAR